MDELQKNMGAADLGVGPLAAVVEGSRDGIVVVTADRRYVYTNPAACRIMGYALEELLALPDFLANFPEREHQAMLEHFSEQLAGETGLWTSTLLRPDGTEREITWSNMSFEIGGERHGAAVFRDATEARQAARNAAALGQAAAQLAGRNPLNVVLWDFAEHAVAGTRAVGCAIGITGEGGDFETGAAPGVTDGFRNISLSSGLRIEDLPDGDVLLSGRPAVVPDARARWLTGPRPDVGASLQELDWQTAVHIPLSWGEQVLGAMAVFLPSSVSGPTEAELAFYTALADQAAIAVINDRLLAETGRASAMQERSRLARELHDSVSQGLFSMTLHARTAQLAMEKQDLPEDGPLGRSIAQLRELSQAALAEMRALIFELRPDALAEEGLIAAVTKQAAALSARTGLPITIDAPSRRLELAPEVEEQLYRLVLEALNNTVKHACATTAQVTIRVSDCFLTITASDDGVGFDPTQARPGHMGMGSMRDRAEAIGAELKIESGGGRLGSAVTVTLERDR